MRVYILVQYTHAILIPIPSPLHSVFVEVASLTQDERGSGGCETPPSHNLKEDGVVVGVFPFRHSKREWEGEWWV